MVVKFLITFLSNFIATCYTCKEPGHIARDCPSSESLEVEGKIITVFSDFYSL